MVIKLLNNIPELCSGFKKNIGIQSIFIFLSYTDMHNLQGRKGDSTNIIKYWDG